MNIKKVDMNYLKTDNNPAQFIFMQSSSWISVQSVLFVKSRTGPVQNGVEPVTNRTVTCDDTRTFLIQQILLSVVNKSNEGSSLPSPPPSYEEATTGVSPSYRGTYPGEGEMFTEFCWDDLNIRQTFIRKVYAILALQLSVTLAIVSLFTFCDPIKDYVQSNPGWYWAAYAVFFVTYLTLSCCTRPRRQFPWNLILLAIFTLSLSCMTGMLSSYYNTKSVMICLGITVLVCLAVSVFSFQTKHVSGIRHTAPDGKKALQYKPRGIHLCHTQHLSGHCIHLLLFPPDFRKSEGVSQAHCSI